jgi:hypothetical protein
MTGMDKSDSLCARLPRLFPRRTCIQCDSGWHPILERLFIALDADVKSLETDGLVEADNPPRIVEVKEKLGGLRVYMRGPISLLMRDRIKQAEAEAAATCETCGAPGELRDYAGYFATRCPKHGPRGRPGKPLTELPSIRLEIMIPATRSRR